MLISRGAIEGILPSEINAFSVFLTTLLSVLIQEMRAKAGGCRVWLLHLPEPAWDWDQWWGWDCSESLGDSGARGLFSHSAGAGQMEPVPTKTSQAWGPPTPKAMSQNPSGSMSV